jgi:hypothetical protein
MNRLAAYAAIAAALLLSGFGLGWHAKTQRVNAAVVKQVVKVAKVEAKNEAQVEKQNDSDKLKIRELEDRLSAARRDAAARRVPEPPQHCRVPATEGDARPGVTASAPGGPAGGYEEAYRALRDELLVAGATAEQMRLQVLSCQAQWPK